MSKQATLYQSMFPEDENKHTTAMKSNTSKTRMNKRKSNSNASGWSSKKFASAPKAVAVRPQVGTNLTAAMSKGMLGPDQLEVYEFVVTEGRSCFFTGNAGTGKSFLLRAIVKGLRSKHRDYGAVHVTASTGIAAANIGGVTIHSFAGCGYGDADIGELLYKQSKKGAKNMEQAKVLIIDEISMLNGMLFDKINEMARVRRRDPRPFGGLQVIVCGDFSQLPPVDLDRKGFFCFAAQSWADTIQKNFVLTIVRRSKDEELLDLLQDVRYGKLSQRSRISLDNIRGEMDLSDGIEPTILYPNNVDVDNKNIIELKRLQGPRYTYHADDSGRGSGSQHFDKNFRVDKTVVLALNAQVMLMKNIDVENGLTNGARGVIMSFDKNAQSALGCDRMPVIKFTLANGSTKTHTLAPEEFSVEESGKVVAQRTQLPLKLAWAITVHKSQGMTIGRLQLSLSKIFAPGMAYVALSRGVSLKNMRVLDYDASRIKVHPLVEQFDRVLAESTGTKVRNASSSSSSSTTALPSSEFHRSSSTTMQPRTQQPPQPRSQPYHGGEPNQQDLQYIAPTAEQRQFQANPNAVATDNNNNDNNENQNWDEMLAFEHGNQQGTTTHPTPTPTVAPTKTVTDAQREKMQQNRLLALERRKQKQKLQEQQKLQHVSTTTQPMQTSTTMQGSAQTDLSRFQYQAPQSYAPQTRVTPQQQQRVTPQQQQRVAPQIPASCIKLFCAGCNSIIKRTAFKVLKDDKAYHRACVSCL